MSFEPNWKRHVGKVSAILDFVAQKHPDEITQILGVRPTYTATSLEGALDHAFWSYETAAYAVMG